MPKKLHAKLARQATSRGLTGRRKDAYIYSTLRRVEVAKQRKKVPRRARTGRRS